MLPPPATVLIPLLATAHALAAAGPFRDPSLPLERRVDDLFSRLASSAGVRLEKTIEVKQ